MQKHWYFIRHGQTAYNKNSIVQGSGVDSSLDATGIAQANAFFKKYRSTPFDCVITSALKRTHQTVQKFIESGIPWEQTSAINEMNWGIHEGQKSQPWMIANYRRMINAWKEGDLDARVEGGESAKELMTRTAEFLMELKQKEANKVLVCTHGRSLRCLLVLLKNQAIHEMENYSPSNTALYVYRLHGEELKIEIENDLSHLPTPNF